MGGLAEITPGGHATEVEGETATWENSTVADPNGDGQEADSIESNSGFNNGAQGE